jgi:hypothetical protein
VGVNLSALGCDGKPAVSDELLLERLRTLVGRVDPVPERIQDDSRVVFRGFARMLQQDVDASGDDR